MKIKIITVLLCCLQLMVSGQKDVDSLKRLLSVSKPDSSKVDILLTLSRSYFSSNPTEAIRLANEAKDLSLKINYLRGIGYSYKNIGIVNVNQSNYLIGLENYDKALEIFDTLNDLVGKANILSNQGTVYFNRADDEKALELYLKALSIAELTTDSIRISTLLTNIGAIYSRKVATYDKALDYYFRALKISALFTDKSISGTVNSNIGEIYLFKNDADKALTYLKKSLKDYEESENRPYALNMIGKAYIQKADYNTAIRYHQMAYDFAKKIDATIDVTQSLLGLGTAYNKKGEYANAIIKYKEAEMYAQKISNANEETRDAYIGLALAYAKQEDYPNAYKYEALYADVKDSLYNIDADKKLNSLQFAFDIQKKENQVVVQGLLLKKQEAQKNILLGGLGFVFIIIVILYRNYRNKIKVNKILDRQNAEIESLILNVLPQEVAHELQKTGIATPRYYEQASVLFTDFKSFSSLADSLSPQDVVTELNECFVAFDEIIERHKLEKIKTIGDSYMCAGGIPTPDEAHVLRIVQASLDIQVFIKERNVRRKEANLPPWDIRIGINTGPLVAGVVGKKKYAYDIWGGTVNVASRMESNGEPGRVNISEATYELIKDKYACTHRGKIFAKNIGEIDMYFIDHELPSAN